MNFHELLQNEGVTVVKNKGEHIFMQGDVDRSLYIVQTGLLKAYYTSENGKESVKSFILPNDIIGSLSSAYLKKSCSFSLICLESTTLKKIAFDTLHNYSKNNLQISIDMIELLLLFAMKKEKREFEFLCMSAEERFCSMVDVSPVLLEKVTQNDLARYLGVTPVGLSRIKKRCSNSNLI